MYYSIDRIEENMAVCIADDEEIVIVSTDKIVGDYSEGSILKETENEFYIVDEDEEIKRRISNLELAESLFDE